MTGGAGFIGYHVIKRLFADAQQSTIVNVDNVNDYYDVRLKEYRLRELDRLKPDAISYTFKKTFTYNEDTFFST